LIKQGAKLVEHVDDIVEELNTAQAAPHVHTRDEPAVQLTPEEKMVLAEMSPYPMHIDKLIRQLSLSAAQVSTLLLQLELKGLVTQSPGKLMWFNKNGHFAKHDNKESEVSNEYPKNPTALHRRIQS